MLIRELWGGTQALHSSQTLDDASEAALGTVLEVATVLGLKQLCQLPKGKKSSGLLARPPGF